MPESLSDSLKWLHSSEPALGEFDWQLVGTKLVLALAFGLFVAAVFALTQRRPIGQTLPIVTTLILLTILVAMTTIVIGDSVARAFGLVGALSIVRFRTVVEDTRDTSFVIFAVVVGMALGAGNVAVCVLGSPIVALVAFTLSFLDSGATTSRERILEVRVGAGRDPNVMLAEVFARELRKWRLISVVSARQGTSLDAIYRVKLRDPSALVRVVQAIQALEGLQNVELK